MLHRHGNYLVRFVVIGDELNGLSFRLGVLDELFEPSTLDEEFDSILQVDPIVSNVPVALVEPTVFGFVDLFPLLQGAFGGLTPASVRSATAISARIFSPDIAKGVYLVKRPLGLLPSRVTLSSFFFSWKGFSEDSTVGSYIYNLKYPVRCTGVITSTIQIENIF